MTDLRATPRHDGFGPKSSPSTHRDTHQHRPALYGDTAPQHGAADEAPDPFDEPSLPMRVIGHGPGHPAGRAAAALGQQLRRWREEQGLSQQAVSARLGWAQPHVARLEAGAHTPNLATIDRLARRLQLEIRMHATPDGTSFEVHPTPSTRAR